MGCNDNCYLMQSYFFYSAILALKLLSLAPLADFMCNPERIKRGNISDLKNLTPFWLVAALYITTSPNELTAKMLLRAFVAARVVAALGYIIKLPKCLEECAFYVSFCITSYMGGWVIYTYRNAI